MSNASETANKILSAHMLQPDKAEYVTLLDRITAALEQRDCVIEELMDAANKLANEASGFLSMANRNDHGTTNMQVLQHWIDNARQALAVADKLRGDK